MAKVVPTKIRVIYGDNHKQSLLSAIEILKSKATVEITDSKMGNKSAINVLKHD